MDAGDSSNQQLTCRGVRESEMLSPLGKQWKQGYWSWLSRLKMLREVVFASDV